MATEYTDFIYSFRPGQTWYKNGLETEARAFFWSKHQMDINEKLQQMKNDGWVPVSDVGPAAFKISLRKQRSIDLSDCIWYMLSFGLFFLLHLISPTYDYYREPVEFRVKMMRE